MAMTDSIADFPTRIHDANMVKRGALEVPASEIKRDVAEIPKREGLIRDTECIEDDKQGVIRIFLKRGKNEERATINLKRTSKSGLRAYIKANEVPKVLDDLGVVIISISESVITSKGARAKDTGDEIIAYVW